MSNQIQHSFSLDKLEKNTMERYELYEQIYGKRSMLASSKNILEESNVESIDSSRKKRKQEKKKERKRKHKQEKVDIEQAKISQLKEIMRKIYEGNDDFYIYQSNVRQISKYIYDENAFLNELNSVIAGYADKSLGQMEMTFDLYLKEQGIQFDLNQAFNYDKLLSERPELFKKLIDYLYCKFVNIRRAGENVHMILKTLRLGFKNEKSEYAYEDLDRDIFEYLTQNNAKFKRVIVYGFKALVQKIKPLKPIDDHTLKKITQIFKVMRFPTEHNEEQQRITHPDSDRSTQASQKSGTKRKNKTKKKAKSQISNLEEIQQYLSLDQLTLRIIDDLQIYQDRVPIQVSSSFISSLQALAKSQK